MVRMLLPQLAPPRLARLSLRPLQLLPAAMTAPRAAGRGVRVRVRERARRWGGRARRQRRARGGEGMRGRPEGRRARACCSHSLRGRKAKRACCTGSTRCTPGSARKDLFPGADSSLTSQPRTWECALASGEAVILTLLLLLSNRRVSWRGGNPPHVARVSSWTWTRTPEGPLRAREEAAPEPTRLLSVSKGSKVPTPDCFQLLPAPRARRRLAKRFPPGCPDSCRLPFGSGCGAGRSCGLGTGKIPCFAAATPPNLSHILRKGGFLRQLLQTAWRRG